MKPRIKQLRKRLAAIWRPLLAAALTAGASVIALVWQLQSLAPRLSPGEAATRAHSLDLIAIAHNPQHAPYRLLEWIATRLPEQWSVAASRVPSVICALVALTLVIFLLRRWYGQRTMIFGFVIVLCSAWLLHIGRFAGTDIEYFTAVLALLAVHVGLHDKEDSTGMFFLWLSVNLVLLFIPGMVWFVLVSAALQPLTILHAWQAMKLWWQRLVVVMLTVIGLGAPAAAITYNPASWASWLGLPDGWQGLHAVPGHMAETLAAIGIRGPHNPQLWLGQLPIFDLFLLVALIAGVAFYARHWQAARSRLLGACLVMGLLLTSLGVVSISVVVPVCYLIIAAGIAYLLHFWLRTFPLNPVARNLGIGILAIVIGLSCYYNLVQYFVAWPHNPEVSVIYQR